MNNKTFELLEYDQIKNSIKNLALTDKAKKIIDEMKPLIYIEKINLLLKETTEARKILDIKGSVPIANLSSIEEIMAKIGIEAKLAPGDFTAIAKMLESVGRMKRFMKDMEQISIVVAAYANSMYEIIELKEEINKCILYDDVDDKATKELHKIRKRKSIVETRIREKLNSLLASTHISEYIQEFFISKRNGKYVIPVKREYKKQFDGDIIGSSTKGSTVYIEPSGVKKLREEYEYLSFEEEKEVNKILSDLTRTVELYKKELKINIETIVHYDFVFSKAKYSKKINGINPEINNDKKTLLLSARHPLLVDGPVPLEFEIGFAFNALLITGPNTGGKTVAIKTVGLLTLMAQSGLHIPCAEGSLIGIYEKIYVDIGDGQSIEQSLSTFSSHIKNISAMLYNSDKNTLVILDELGAGTDPTEGMGLAVAILEELKRKGTTIVATTHYSEIKSFARDRKGFENGCMEFDINTLKPIFKLSIGKPGESNALIIAHKLGIDEKVVQRAHEICYNEKKIYKKLEISMDINGNYGNKENEKESIKLHLNKRVTKKVEDNEVDKKEENFSIGDLVNISFMGKRGVVCETENSKGELVIMIMKKKYRINKKRVDKFIDKKEMYPDEYDMDIVFESKENRKKKKIMNKRHEKGIFIEKDKE